VHQLDVKVLNIIDARYNHDVYLSLQEAHSWMVLRSYTNNLNLWTCRRKGVFENQHTRSTQPTCTRCQLKEQDLQQWMDEHVCVY